MDRRDNSTYWLSGSLGLTAYNGSCGPSRPATLSHRRIRFTIALIADTHISSTRFYVKPGSENGVEDNESVLRDDAAD